MDNKEFEERLQAMSERVLSKAITPEEETNYTESLFESIRHVNKFGEEFWYARELQIALSYKRWDRFLNVIEKAKKACTGSGYTISDHFSHMGKMVNIGSGAEHAKQAGITEPIDYAIFQNKGYQGLYGGLSRKEIHVRKGLKKNQDILDHMGSTELAANLFRATQTDEKIRKEHITGKEAANKSIQQIEREQRNGIDA